MKILTALVAVLLVAGCGVRASGTIAGGPAPKVSLAGTPLFFVSNGKVSMVLRPTPPLSAPESLNLLAAGPNAAERAAGFGTELPAKLRPPFMVYNSEEYVITVRISLNPQDLSELAAEQIVCTIEASRTSRSGSQFVIDGPNNRREASCPLLGR